MNASKMSEFKSKIDSFEHVLDGIKSYQGYSRARISNSNEAISKILSASTESTIGELVVTKSINARNFANLLDILILESIGNLIKKEKSKVNQIPGFDSEIKKFLDASDPHSSNYQVGLQIASRLSNIPGYSIIGYDDVLISTPSGTSFSIECKQPESTKGISSAVSKGISQLEDKHLNDKNFGDYGVIAVSLDKILLKTMEKDIAKKYAEVQNIITSTPFHFTDYMIGVLLTSNHIKVTNQESAIGFDLITIINSVPILSTSRTMQSLDVINFQKMINDMRNNRVVKTI